MTPYVYKEGMSAEEQKDGAYWERNMLALVLANMLNKQAIKEQHRLYGHTKGRPFELPCGYYIHGEWPGWSRVISINHGEYTFHVPDDFDIGYLPQIEPNWDGHSTEEKWHRLMNLCGIKSSSNLISSDKPQG